MMRSRRVLHPSYILFDVALLKDPMSLPVDLYQGFRMLYQVVLISGEEESKKDEVVGMLLGAVQLAYAMPVFCPADVTILSITTDPLLCAGRSAIARLGYNPDFVVLDKNEDVWLSAGIRVVKIL